MEKIAQRALVIVLCALLLGLGVLFWLLPDQAVSSSERRRLAQLPAPSWSSLHSGEWMDRLEDYYLDQFPGREGFRAAKAITALAAGRQDVNGLYRWQGGIYKQEYPLNADQLTYGAKTINHLYETCLKDMRVFYGVIPDKSCYAAGPAGQLQLSLDALRSQLREEIDPTIGEIDLTGCLTAKDYYLTDPHWRQDRLDGGVQQLSAALDLTLPAAEEYTAVSEPFLGAYAGQLALPVDAEPLVWLESDALRAATVETMDTGTVTGLYPAPAGMDGYDRFLGGAAAVQVLDTPGADTDRELLLFRDSFGSSLAPLLLEGYRRITLIDLRYISTDRLSQQVRFEDQDVLILLSTLVWNHAAILR